MPPSTTTAKKKPEIAPLVAELRAAVGQLADQARALDSRRAELMAERQLPTAACR
jgi:hypothetical protein